MAQPAPLPYKAVQIPGKDLGLVATQQLDVGDHIISETASLMVDNHVVAALSECDVRRLQAKAVEHLPPHHRDKLLELSTQNETVDHLQMIDMIIRFNAYDVEIYNDGDPLFHAVYLDISRINHDCRPNANYYWDPKTLTQHVHTVRPIAPGEEITLSYIDALQFRDDRLEQIESMCGFRCHCSTCQQDTAAVQASDARVGEIATLFVALGQEHERHQYTHGNAHWQARHAKPAGSSAATSPEMAERLITLLAQERLEHLLHEPFALAAVEWNAAGEADKAVRYAQMAVQYGRLLMGPGHRDLAEMEVLMRDPYRHWSRKMKRRWA